MMKRVSLWAVALFVFTACGVSTPAVSTGTSSGTVSSAPAVTKAKAAEAYLVFTSDNPDSIVVTVDGKEYRKESVQVKTSGNMKELQNMAGNIITLTPGTHNVTVKNKNGAQVFQQQITVSAQENKVIKL